jgi:hypothetical protein
MFYYKKKYLKYKNKYLKLKDLVGGENNFKCVEDSKVIEKLCDEDKTGEYKDKATCEKICLEKKLKYEFIAWAQLFAWSSENLKDIHIYCKGGSALGLEVLKSILNKDLSKYGDFVDLKLIKDWDFTVNMLEEQKSRFINKAEELGFQNQGSRLPILRFKNGLFIGDDYLLELSIKTTNELHDLELPLTNLKFEVNSTNIELFFDIVKMYVKKEINLEIIKYNLNKLLTTIIVNGDDQVDSIKNGLYIINNSEKISTADLNKKLLEIIDLVPYQQTDYINQSTLKQFLISQICQPDRLFLRFFDKNVIKSNKIKKLYVDNKIPLTEWLLDETILDELKRKITSFLDLLNQYIESQIKIKDETFDENKQALKPFLEIMEKLFVSINLARIKTVTETNKLLVRKLVPWNFLQKLKCYSLRIKKMQEEETKKKLPPEILEMKQKQALTKVQTVSFNYKVYFPSIKNSTEKDIYKLFIYNVINGLE